MAVLQTQPSNSWAAEVSTDDTGKWYPNNCRFATQLEAEQYARDLSGRWFAVLDWRVVPSADPVNYRWYNEARAMVSVAQTCTPSV
jgi:hypothetical protein